MLMRNPVKNKTMNKLAPDSISVFECAAFSLDVYEELNSPARLPLPPGWKVFADSPASTTGYCGRCYIKNFDSPSGPYWVVFAHRGTVLNEFRTILASLDVALGNIPSQIDPAARFVINTQRALLSQFENLDLSNVYGMHTGHSLGGVIADVMAVGLNITPTVTFENPGSKPIICKYLHKNGLSDEQIQDVLLELKESCETYLADVNLINTCNEQVGESWRMHLPWKYGAGRDGAMLPITSDYRTNPYYLMYTVLHHRIDTIYEYCKQDGAVQSVQYPVGFKQGYSAYLNPLSRKEYWDGYLARIWATHPNFREDFGDIENYRQVFYLTLTQTYNDSLAKLLERKSSLTNSGFGLFNLPDKRDDLAIEDFFMINKDEEIVESLNETSSKRCAIM